MILGAGHLPSFFGPTPGYLDSLCVPTPRNLLIVLKNANAWGGGGARCALLQHEIRQQNFRRNSVYCQCNISIVALHEMGNYDSNSRFLLSAYCTEAHKEVKRSANKDKRDYIDSLAQEGEEAAYHGNVKDLYMTTKKLADQNDRSKTNRD